MIEVIPTTGEYATLPIPLAFDWKKILNSARAQEKIVNELPLYLVAFRSTLRPGADTTALLEHDQSAHDAALESPALIHYFGGIPNANGQALSFCLWQEAESAKIISQDGRHKAATAMVHAYDQYSIEKYNVHHRTGTIYFESLANRSEPTSSR